MKYSFIGVTNTQTYGIQHQSLIMNMDTTDQYHSDASLASLHYMMTLFKIVHFKYASVTMIQYIFSLHTVY